MDIFKGYFKSAWNHKWKIISTTAIFYGSYKFITNRTRSEELYYHQKKHKMLNDTQSASKEMLKKQKIIIASKIDEISEVTKIITSLRTPNLSSDEKKQLWNDLKITSFASITTTVYAFTIMVIYIRISLNIVGKYIYQREILKEKMNKSIFNMFSFDEDNRPIDNATFCDISPSINKKFLSTIDYFINHGLQELYDIVYEHSKNVLGGWELNEECSYSDLQNIFFQIRSNIEIVNVRKILLKNFVLPKEENRVLIDEFESVYNIISEDDKYTLLENELREDLDSDYMNHFFLELLKITFESLNASFSSKFDLDSTKIVMAKLVPQIDKQRKTLLQNDQESILESVSFVKVVEKFFYDYFNAQI